MGKVEKYKELLDRFSMFFVSNGPGFHELLWKIVNNEMSNDKRKCFHTVIEQEGYILALVYENETGFVNTKVLFIPEIANYDIANDITQSLNRVIFGLGHKETLKIVLSSMREL